jgi:hypothetical protein
MTSKGALRFFVLAPLLSCNAIFSHDAGSLAAPDASCGYAGGPSCAGGCTESILDPSTDTCVACDTVVISLTPSVDRRHVGSASVSFQVSRDVGVLVSLTNAADASETQSQWSAGTTGAVTFTGLKPLATYDVLVAAAQGSDPPYVCPGGASGSMTLSYAPFTATWSGHTWLWSTMGPTNDDFSMPVSFSFVGGKWTMTVDAFTFPNATLQPGAHGSGVVDGIDATLQLPVRYSGAIDFTLSVSTNATISPPAYPPGTSRPTPTTVGGYSECPGCNSLLQMVGQGTTADGKVTVWAFVNGHITAWP